MPLVSVVIPTYNRADLIFDTIESVLHQSFEDIEIVIADDGSSDATETVIKQINDRRIIYNRCTHSGVPASPRNKAIKAARGEIIAFLDSDDLWLPNKLEKCVELLQHNQELGLVCSNEYLLNVTKTKEKLIKNKTSKVLYFEDLLRENVVSSSTVVMRKKILDDIGLFDESESFRAVEDYHLWLRISLNYPIYYFDEPLGYYRIHDGSIRLNVEKSLKNLSNVYSDILKRCTLTNSKYNDTIISQKRKTDRELLKYYIRTFQIIKSIKLLKKPFSSGLS